ncbi:MAG: hypothetical protein V4559_10715 [Pseudomonadota bacterium]
MKRLVALLTLVFWSISMTASASAGMSVLCVEQDGQRVVEYSVDTHCYDPGDATGAQDSSVKSTAHCTDCVDTPLVSTATAHSPKATDEPALAKIRTYVVAFLTSTPSADKSSNRIARAPLEPLAMRSAYMGQRGTIIIQQ